MDKKFIEWDKRWYLHALATQDELHVLPAEGAEGNYVIDDNGDKLLDMFAQLGCVNMGQRHPAIQSAIKGALDRFGFVWDLWLTEYRAETTKLIMKDLIGRDGWGGKVRYTCSGSEAAELGFQIAKLTTQRPNIIVQEYGYHGWTLAAMSATRSRASRGLMRNPKTKEIRDIPGVPAPGFQMVPAPFCYRCPYGCTYPDCKEEGGRLPMVNRTEQIIRELGPETVAAIVTEPEFGAGSIVTPPEYNRQIRKLATELGILWIDDEVFTGFGRTGTWFAYQHDLPDVTPDIMLMGKGLTSSALPIGGVVVSKKIADLFEEYRWGHVNTFAAHPLVMAAAAANIRAMIDEDILSNVKKVGKYLGDGLKDLERKHRCVGLVDGKGLQWVVEIVKNKKTREPFIKEDRYHTGVGDTSKYPTSIINQKGIEKGVIWGISAPNSLRIAPALTINKEEVDKALVSLDYALTYLDSRI